MSLLTDEEIGDLLDLEKEKEYPCSVGSVSTVDVDAVVDASQTRTLKAVAEGYAGDCSVESHPGRPPGRVGCMNCKEMLLAALWKGELPND